MRIRWSLISLFIIFSASLLLMATTLFAKSLGEWMIWVGIVYTIIIALFLLGQIFAFVWAHTSYREDIESPKYKIFELEGMESEKL